MTGDRVESGARAANSGTDAPSGCESLSWTVRLSDVAPEKRFAVLAVAVLAGLLGIALFRHPLFGLLGFAIILGATTEFWLGSRFSVGPRGVSARTGLSVSSMDWSQAKRVVVGEREIRVSPLEEPTRMEPFRGVSLRTTPAIRERVLEIVRACCGNHVRILGD